MATLTTSYQKIAEKSIGTSSGGTTYKLRLYARYTSQSTSGNSTTVQVQLRHYVPNGYIKYYSSSQKITGTITASGSNATNKQFDAGEATLLTKSSTITHNQDGTKSISIGATFTNSYFGNTVTISNTSVTLPKINRLATITSAGDFTDEENPTIQFNNPAGFTVYPYLNFYDEAGTKVYGLYRNSSSATSPYTWAITDDERTAMRNATNLQQKYSVSIGVDTYNGSTKLGYNSKSYTMTYVNAEPSQSTAFTETNSKVIDVLGTSDANTIIQNVSQLRLTSTPSVKKGATVTKISFEHNLLSTDDFDSPYEHIFVPTNSKFKVTINDSRKYSIAEEYTKSIVEYVPVDISSHSFKRESPTSSNVIVNAQIRYKQATFGSNVNSPTIQWKLNEDGALTTLSSSDYIIDDVNNTIVISDLVLYDVLPYNTSGKFFLYVNDLLSEDVERAIEVPKGIPTCDMGEHDFKVNGELYVADEEGKNKVNILNEINFLKTKNVLWNGSNYMNEVQSIDLSETPISAQPNGIVLVFCAYENSSAKDYDFKTFFIPKEAVRLKSGVGHDFILNTPNFGKMGTKYLYISDDRITGHANNTATGTGTSGIKYTNSYWVLRYVIGV